MEIFLKKLQNFERLEGEILHSPFYPSDIREGDRVSAELFVEENYVKMRVWRYSPFGIELVVPKDLQLAGNVSYKMKIFFPDDELTLDSVQVARFTEEAIGNIVGFRIFTKREVGPAQNDRRKTSRWVCSENYLPTGTAPNPIKFNDHLIFRVDDISVGGMRLLTSMRNKFVYPGLTLECSISIPLVGSISLPLKIKYIDVLNKGETQILSLGTSFIKPNAFNLKCLAEYLLHFGQDVTVDSLMKSGFPIESNLKSFDFSYVKSKWEYESVLELRKIAYEKNGKIDSGARPEDMADRFDARARILMVKKGESIVGSLRAMFHENYQESELFSDGVIGIPDIDVESAVELSRLCTHPEFRGVDIAYNLLAHMYLTAIKADKRFVYAGATGSMIDFYKNLGWNIHDVTYECSSLKGIPHKVISVDIHKAVLGRGVHPKIWNRVYRPLYEYLYERELIFPTPFEVFKIQFLKMFS